MDCSDLQLREKLEQKAKEKVANPLMKFLIKAALNACLFQIIASDHFLRVDITDQESEH